MLKLCGDAIAHKTERDLVRLGLRDGDAVAAAAAELLAKARPEDGAVGLLVAEQVRGARELIAGLVRDPQFGPCVMLGVGGVLAEALRDVVFASVPLDEASARALPDRLATRALLGAFRGEPAIDRDALARVLLGLSRLALERPDVASVDLNPLIVRGGMPIAVDALVELEPEPAAAAQPRARARLRRRGARAVPAAVPPARDHRGRRVDPPGQVRLRDAPQSAPIRLCGAVVRGEPRRRGRARPADACGRSTRCRTAPPISCSCARRTRPTWSSCARARRRACAPRSSRAAATARRARTGRALERELVSVANALGIVLAGPNGQGVISTPVSMCAQIVAPYPPPGRISVASQSGNLVSSFLNYAVASGVGISKAISCGNSAQTTLADYLDYFGADPETAVALAYLEGVPDGAHFIDALRAFTARKPLVLVKGGVAAEGKRAAASHTGSLASDDRVFDGICRQWGALRAPTVEEAYEWAATFATQPLPRGRRVVVFTTAGGWGVLAADACAAAGLELIALPAAVRERVDAARARALEQEQPDRPRGRRDARHDPRGARHRVRPSRRRRGDPPRDRHPGRERERARSRASSTPITGSSGSSTTTSARTAAMPRPRARRPSATASPCSPRPSS